MQKKEKIIPILGYVIPVVLILILCLYHLHDNQMITICGDEFGYWAAGSWFAGYDWSEVQGINSYYGYGYGVLLAFLLRVTTNQTIAYQTALIMNAVMVCMMYFMAVRIIKILDYEERLSVVVTASVSLTAVLFSPNLYFTQLTMAETILTFCYWIIVYNFVLLTEKFTILRLFSFYLFAIISVSIHLRTVGVLTVCIVMGIIMAYRKKASSKKILALAVFFVLSIAGVFLLKRIYQASYMSSIQIHSDANDMTGQIWKLSFLFTKEGMKDFLEGVCGKVFYAINSTFLLSAIPVYIILDCLRDTIKKHKNKEKNFFQNIDFIVIFLLASTLLELFIDALFMIRYHERFDLLTYGRYFEYTLTPLILIGIYVILSFDQRIIRYGFILGIFNMLLSIYINKLQDYNIAKTHVHLTISSFFEILNIRSYAEDSWLAVGLKSFLIFVSLIILIHYNKIHKYIKNIEIVGLMVISIFWIKDAKYTYEKGLLPGATSLREAETSLADLITDLGIQDNLVFYNEGNSLSIMPLQFLLKEYTIHVESDINVIESEDYNYILSVSENAENKGDLDNTKYELIDHSGWLRLWKKR